ncbi:MAG: hypothetical protein ABII85_01635 [Bacillota bacterium]
MNKKKKAIDSVELASRILGLSEILVKFKPESAFLNSEINAVFDDKYYIIYFNETWLSKASADEIMVTALHETRHAYQKANIDFPEFFVGRESKETISEWKKDFENYKPSKNAEVDIEYLTQSIEIDAIAFAHCKMNDLFKITSELPSVIEQSVKNRMNQINKFLRSEYEK